MEFLSFILGSLNLFVLILTLGAIVWYTVVTAGIHRTAQIQLRELVRQRRLSVIPTLLPEIKALQHTDSLVLTNIGVGIAINIHIEDVHYAPSKLPESYYSFELVPLLRQNESVEVSYKERLEGVLLEPPSGLAHFKRGITDSNVVLRINFQDIEGYPYQEQYQMGKDIPRLISLSPVGPGV